jgi:hypothetical protein
MIDLDEIQRIAEGAPQGKWEVWTSNSWRRVMAPDHFRDRPGTMRVIEPTIHPHDKHPDLMFGLGVIDWLENVNPSVVLELVAEVRELRKDKARLDSGRIIRTEYDEFGDRIGVDSRGNDLRKMIDEALEMSDE